jgi:hypothetical protein
MEIILITVVILILASGGLFYRHNDLLAVPSVMEGMTEEKNSLTERMSHFLTGFLNGQDKGLGLQFNESLTESALSLDAQFYRELPESAELLKNWLATLDAEEAETFANQVAAFSSSMNLELSWLLDQELNDDPNLKQTFEEAIALYCLANFRAAQVQEELRLFITYRAWRENPSGKGYKELTQELFAKLVDKGLAEPAPTNLFLAPNKRRQKHAESAIREAAAKDKQAFYGLLKEAIAYDNHEDAQRFASPTLVDK